jgi:hypothetical protein
MNIDDLIYPLLVDSFPEVDSGEVLDIVEEFKHPRGLDVLDEFKDEIWQKYLARAIASGAGVQCRSLPAAQRRRRRRSPRRSLSFYLITNKHLPIFGTVAQNIPKNT